MKMKLSIQTNIVTELKKLVTNTCTDQMGFLFGKMTRNGFKSFLSEWDYNCIKDTLRGKYSLTRKRVGERKVTPIKDIGFVSDRRILLGKVNETDGDSVELITFKIGTYNLILIKTRNDYQVELRLCQDILSLAKLFEPVKFLYGLIRPRIKKLDTIPKTVIDDYNNLFDKKQDTPWIIPQGMKFLTTPALDKMKNYTIMPLRRSKKHMLYLGTESSFMFSKNSVWDLDLPAAGSLQNTVVMGEWYEDAFTGYDVAMINGKDIRHKSLKYRLSKLRIISLRFPFCECVKFYTKNIHKYVKPFVSKYDGAMFIPQKAHYSNNRVFSYQPIEKIGFTFNVNIEKQLNGSLLYSLKAGGKEFCGTDEFPYVTPIPLSREDRSYIGTEENNKIEFRWENNSFIPFLKVHNGDIIPSTTDTMNAWNYIHQPLDIEFVIRSFKKVNSPSK